MAELPAKLALAKRWLEAAGDTVELSEAPEKDETLTPSLIITHGSIKLQLVQREDQLAVTVSFSIPAEARAKFRTLPEDVRRKLFVVFRQELLSCHRVGFVYQPLNATEIGAIESYLVVALLVVAPRDPSTRNRLLDAVQEVVTTGIRAGQVLGIAASGGNAPPPPTTAPPPPGIYG